MSGRVVHFELPVDDGARARAFYERLFGWRTEPYPGGAYVLVTTGPTPDDGGPPTEPGFINGGLNPRGEAPSDAPVLVIDVEDIDAALARVEGEGGRVVSPRAPVGEMGFAAYFQDTEGNVVGLWETARS